MRLPQRRGASRSRTRYRIVSYIQLCSNSNYLQQQNGKRQKPLHYLVDQKPFCLGLPFFV